MGWEVMIHELVEEEALVVRFRSPIQYTRHMDQNE